MNNRLLNQEEIDSLLNSQGPESGQNENEADNLSDAVVASDTAVVQSAGSSAESEEILTEEQKDALGEIGNICMGSSSTSLSMQINQPVSITSPRVTISTLEKLFKGFDIPHMSIRVHYTEGFTGYNLLVMKLHDTAVLADLMMGGDGTNISENISEMGISAASEAMNQMIASAATAMATMFGRTVNISPPETVIYHNREQLDNGESSEQVVIVWFRMTVGDILDTQIMQVMDVNTAKQQAGLILGHLDEYSSEAEAPAPASEQESAATLEITELEKKEDAISKLENGKEVFQPTPAQQAPVLKTQDAPLHGNQIHSDTISTGNSNFKKTVSAPQGIEQQRLDLILDIHLKVTVVLGRTKWPIKDILALTPGSVIELQSLVDEPVEVLVNGTLVAWGEVVVINENFGVRLTGIVKQEERLQSLGG
ncbi:MAG: flagellar motor switch phosphatase FliY [Peptococcaceae bacterium]|jgi:flagellar motor switch protein FliN/FliY|nr:flagellar motor switch phosphatase FliY [Peptococcaceae bacterium]